MQAAIDIGSNTVRLLIGEVVADRVQVHSQALLTTRLGNTRVGEKLSAVGRQKTIAALQQFAEQLRQAGVSQPPVVAATSAVREAADGADFQQEVQQKLGWQLQILSGVEEAACSFAGAASVLSPKPDQKLNPADRLGGRPALADVAVLDVGGGSTELICRQPDGQIVGHSVRVGAVRLFNDEARPEDLPQRLAELLPAGGLGPLKHFVSVGGTITLVAALLENISEYSREAVSGRCVTRAEIAGLRELLAPLSPAARLQRYPMLLGREDIIIAGLTIYLALADLLGAAEFVASDAGLLDGLLLRDGGALI